MGVNLLIQFSKYADCYNPHINFSKLVVGSKTIPENVQKTLSGIVLS